MTTPTQAQIETVWIQNSNLAEGGFGRVMRVDQFRDAAKDLTALTVNDAEQSTRDCGNTADLKPAAVSPTQALIKDALAWFDWINLNSDWLTRAIAKEYSAAKADEFALRAFNAREAREGLRAALTAAAETKRDPLDEIQERYEKNAERAIAAAEAEGLESTTAAETEESESCHWLKRGEP